MIRTSVIANSRLALEASERHARTPETDRLVVGLDVGYEGDDETVAQPRRGKKTLLSHAVRKKDGPDVARWLLDLLFGTPLQTGLAKAGEKPLVIVDKNGYGASAYDQYIIFHHLAVVAVPATSHSYLLLCVFGYKGGCPLAIWCWII